MIKEDWINKVEEVNIKTKGGYSFEQVMNNKNCSKDPSYWKVISSTKYTNNPKFLFKSSVAESWEFWDNEIDNPIRNTNQIYLRFLNVTPFVEPSNYFRKHKVYHHSPRGTIGYNKFWRDIQSKCLTGFEVEGVRITGRHFFTINFGRFRAIPVDKDGKETSKTKIWTFLRFIDLQYYLFHELEDCFLEGPFNTRENYLKWFPLKDEDDFINLKLENFGSTKGRRKGWTAAIATGVFNYNFTFKKSSMNILAAYEKAHYGPMLRSIHNTKTFLNKNTAFVRVTEILGQRDHFIAGVKTVDENNVPVNIGYLSEIYAVSFKDNIFKAIGDSADVINIEECLAPGTKVLMYNMSYKSIEDIQVGDLVMGVDSLPKEVGSIHSGEDEMYKIKQFKGKDYIINSKHKLFLEQRTKVQSMSKYDGFKYLSVEDVNNIKSKYLKRTLYGVKVGKLNFNNSNVDINPYLLGCWLGDGDSKDFTIGCDINHSKEIITFIKNYIKEYNIPYIVYQINNNFVSYRIGAKGAGIKNEYNRLLKNYNIKNNKRIPIDYIKSEEHTRLKLLAGIIDTDGHLSVKKYNVSKSYEIILKNTKLVDDIALLARTLGFYVAISNKKIKYRGEYKIYKRIRISGELWRIPVLIKRKQVKKYTIKNSILSSKIEIEHIGKGNYYGFTLKGNSDVDNLFILEDFTITKNSGKFDHLIEAFPVSFEPLIRDGEIFIGNVIAGGTAGDMEGGSSAGLYEILNNPKQFGFKTYENIYEETPDGKDVGWFIDDMWYSPNIKSKKHILSLDSSERTQILLDKFKGNFIKCVDEQGNSYRYFSEILLDGKRNEKRGISNLSYLKFITQQPKYLSEAFLMDESSPFDVATAKAALGDLISNQDKIPIEKGSFYLAKNENGSVSPKWRLDLSINVIDEHPWKGENVEGGWIIYEKPQRVNGQIMNWRYIAGVDPIDFGSGEVNEGNKHSFAATYVIDTLTRNIVAEYVTRPELSDHFYEQLWRGIEYYNAELLYENNLKGVYTYFKNKNKLHLLAEEPLSLKDLSGYKMSKNLKKGVHATPASNKLGREHINTWSMEDVFVSQDDEGNNVYIPRMFLIRSKGLLQEIISWNSKGNFDRISALGVTMILLFDRNITKEDFNKNNYKKPNKLFDNLRSKMIKKTKPSKDTIENEYKQSYFRR